MISIKDKIQNHSSMNIYYDPEDYFNISEKIEQYVYHQIDRDHILFNFYFHEYFYIWTHINNYLKKRLNKG